MSATKIYPTHWNESNIPDLSGRRYLITGGTSGLGKSCAKQLARHGADVVITARSREKATAVLSELGSSRITSIELDLTDLSSVRNSANTLNEDGRAFDAVLLNAGIMATPFATSIDGFEMQMATNHLGHFAFSGLIKNLIRERLVVVSSFAHRMGSFGSGSLPEIRDRFLGVGKYQPWSAYGNTKLANLLFVSEVERRRLREGWSFIPVAAHPGYANTNLQMVASQMRKKSAEERVTRLMNKVFAQSADDGALPILCATVYPDLAGAAFLGPSGVMELRGAPKLTRARSVAYDQVLSANLWQMSEELTDVHW